MTSEGLLGEVSQRFGHKQAILYGGLLLTFSIGHIRGVADGYPGSAEQAARYALESGLMWSFYLFVASLLVVGLGLAVFLLTEREAE